MPSPLILSVVALAAPQDLVDFEGRRPMRGSAPYQDDEIVRFNPYFSTHPQMVWNTEEFPAEALEGVERDWPAVEEFRHRLAQDPDVEELIELADFAKEHKLKDERLLALEQALRQAPADERLIKAYGRRAALEFVEQDVWANPELRAELEAMLEIEEVEVARDRAEEIVEARSLEVEPIVLARAHRSARIARGLQEKRPLQLRADEVEGTYALFVPSSYHPLRPTPLLIGLHGGGPTEDGQGVVGSGESAMSFYHREAERRGYLVACPTARRAPWRNAMNEPMVRAVLDEMKALFNVDLGRIYLTGHSMGGFGAWHFGPLYCEEWAGFGPMAGGGSRRANFSLIEKTRTFVYLYHGSNDDVVRPGDTQAAAERLLKGEFDFVYTEIPDSGHGLPSSVTAEMLDFFERKRQYVGRKTSTRPRSSFEAKESRDEGRAYGALFPR